jgi:AcrR family transcriptional regulator
MKSVFDQSFHNVYGPHMTRPRAFDEQQALAAAIVLFGERGYEGSSAEMLVGAMGIGRQSLYNTFGDKWQLYRAAVQQYVASETQGHHDALRSTPKAIDGIEAMIGRVVSEAHRFCLGVSSVCEFGRARPDLTEIHDQARAVITASVVKRVTEAQADGDISAELVPDQVAQFLFASFAGIRIAARSGANEHQLRTLGDMALRALR